LWHYNQPAIVLYDAVRDDNKQLGAVTIDDPEIVERLGSQGAIEEVPVAAISDSPYSVREPDDADPKQFVKLTRERGHLLTFPIVRPIDRDGGASENTADAYEVVIGHRRRTRKRRPMRTAAGSGVSADDRAVRGVARPSPYCTGEPSR
jgi:hypothetical protein